MNNSWRQKELVFILLYAVSFYIIIIHYSLRLSRDHYYKLYGLRSGWISSQLNDTSDAQWRNFRTNLPILTFVFGLFTFTANILRACYSLKAKGMSTVWLLISLAYLSYLHGAFIFFILSIASANFLLVKIFGRTKYFPLLLWLFNLSFLLCNRVYEGYSFSSFGARWAYLDKFRGTFRWHICFNFVILRMISFGYDYFWSDHKAYVDEESVIAESHSTMHHLLFRKNMLQSFTGEECGDREVFIYFILMLFAICTSLYCWTNYKLQRIRLPAGYTSKELYTQTSGLVRFSLGP